MESLIAMTIIACLAVAGASVLVIGENRRLRSENTILWDLLHRHAKPGGRSFPVGPAAGYKFFRTDLKEWFEFDGHIWLSVPYPDRSQLIEDGFLKEPD